MAYTLRHTIWFPNRGKCGQSLLGITPSSKYMYKEQEIIAYRQSIALMSSALLHVSDQVTDNSASLVATTGSDASYTDGKNIVVGTNPMNEHDDPYDGMDILMGLACHESCHCAFTDFNDYSLDKVMKYAIGKWLSNLYEDECIEEMLIHRNKQWAFFLDAVVSHYFSYEKLMPQLKKAALSKSKVNYAQIMLLVMVRQPELARWFPKDWLDDLGPMLDEIYEKVIVKLNNPSFFPYSPTSTVNKATIETIEIMKKYMSLDDLSSTVDMKKGMIGNSSSEASSGKQFDSGISDKKREQEAKKARKKNDLGTQAKATKAREKIQQEQKNNNEDEENATGLFKSGLTSIGAAKWNETDKIKYDVLKSKLKEEIAAIKKILIPNEKKIEHEMDKFHRNGQLMSSHLAQAIQGVNCIYQRKVVKVSEDESSPKYAVVLAIDESGSMEYRTKVKGLQNLGLLDISSEEFATAIAVAFYEAMRDFKDVDLYIYGHGDHIIKYVTPTDNVPYRLASRKRQYGQNEALSYDAIYRDVRLQTNKPIVFFNISDCNYLASGESIREVVNRMKKERCIVSLFTVPNVMYEEEFNEKAIPFNDELYGKDEWIHLSNRLGFLEGVKNLAKIFRKNLNKYKR